MSSIVWSHSNSTADSNGIAWASSGNSGSTTALAGGGYAHYDANGSSTETSGASASGLLPLVASFPEFDSGTGRTTWRVGFAAAPGLNVRVHTVATVA